MSVELKGVQVAEALQGELRTLMLAALKRAVKKGLTHDQFGGSIRSGLREFARNHELKQIELNIDATVDDETFLTRALREIEYSLATGGLLNEVDKLLVLIERAVGVEWQAPARAPDPSEIGPRPYDPKAGYTVGATVVHAKFGTGNVVSFTPTRVTVRFPEGEKILVHDGRAK